jgi:hypothetical protein
MTKWRKCIITYADFRGVKKLAAGGKASRLMREIHNYVANQAIALLPSHAGIYAWNDSILLVAYFTDRKDKERILREQSAFKATIDERVPKKHRPYAIVVQGKTFPNPHVNADRNALHPEVIVLKSSSWAMANCFIIEHMSESMSRNNRAIWYIDSRVAADVKLENQQRRKRSRLYPSNKPRSIVLIQDHELRFKNA